ncbi:MATE family efflux transporter [Aeromonas sp. sif2416]|uniref:MATE family efflux transporter n=1 Tax=Aeromonas sp. sif2416 TaxID=2854793 RepID=UPI001C4816E4|nr:MATE family efflux transporter [Aeromonas sp. sif2416]MBV7435715.1 polysaccharide biosynthesis C-terminal domain-containing protein [Aeromonas sp. sif2416]
MSAYFTRRQRAMTRRFWGYALPSILAMLVSGAYYLVDGIFVGHYVGAAGLAGINLVYPVIMVLIGLAAMIAMGAATAISFQQGAKNLRQARQALVNALWLLVLLGTTAPLLLYHWHIEILLGLGIEQGTETWQQASDYLLWIGGGTLLLASNLAVPYLLRNDGRPRLAMILVSAGAVLNILLNYVMVGRLGLGLVGTAQATLISEGIVSLLGLGYFFSSHARLRLSWRQLAPDLPAMPGLLFTGLPSLIAQFNLGLLLLLHNSQLMVHGSVKDLAGFTVAGYTEAVFIVILQGLAFGIQPLISQAAGARRHRDLKFLMEMGLKITLIYGMLVWLLIQLLPRQVAMLYTGDQDEELLSAAVSSLTLNLAAIPLEGIIMFGIVLLQSMARTRQALIISAAKTLLLLPLIFLLPLQWGRDGVLMAQPTTVLLLTLPLCWLLWREWRRLALACAPRPLRRTRPLGPRQEAQLTRRAG